MKTISVEKGPTKPRIIIKMVFRVVEIIKLLYHEQAENENVVNQGLWSLFECFSVS